MSINPYDSPETAGRPAERPPAKRGLRLIDLLAVIVIIGIGISLLLPNVRTSREAARRMSCSNNLKQIGIALRNYEEECHCLPPACTVDATGKPLHSWRTLILPYMDQQSLYDTIDLSKPWDDPANKQARQAQISTYQCPSATAPAGTTTYLAVVGASCCLRPAAPRWLSEITDDHGHTLMVMEVDAAHAVHWMSPQDASESLVQSFASAGPLAHPGGAQGLFLDGHVVFLSQSTRPDTLLAMMSIAGNDDQIAGDAN